VAFSFDGVAHFQLDACDESPGSYAPPCDWGYDYDLCHIGGSLDAPKTEVKCQTGAKKHEGVMVEMEVKYIGWDAECDSD